MSSNQKRLKVFSFAIMGLALLNILGGVFMLVASPLAAGVSFEVAGDMTDGVIAAEVLGIVSVIVGAYCLIVGVSGARTANSPRNVRGFQTLDMVLILASVIEFGMGLSTGSLSWAELALALVGICAYVYAVKAHEETLG